ncbi:9217_t:CDS:1, partial [Ambispora gerdemannii]
FPRGYMTMRKLITLFKTPKLMHGIGYWYWNGSVRIISEIGCYRTIFRAKRKREELLDSINISVKKISLNEVI